MFAEGRNSGFVQAADYDKWKADFGNSEALFGGADGNGNGVVDAADFVVWREAFGGGPGTEAASVPEPVTSAVVWWITLFTWSRTMMRRGRSCRMGARPEYFPRW